MEPPKPTLMKDEPGFEEVIVVDGRRGLWMRNGASSVELCAGREGDDAYVKLEFGKEIDADTLNAVVEVMKALSYAVELAESDEDTHPDPITAEELAEELSQHSHLLVAEALLISWRKTVWFTEGVNGFCYYKRSADIQQMSAWSPDGQEGPVFSRKSEPPEAP